MMREKRASILLIVLVMIIFTAAALHAFMERASDDLLVEVRAATANRLRPDGYSALEVTLGVLNEFIQANGGLRSPAEGWGDPLAFAGFEPASGHTIEVTFQDESGKLSLPETNATQLNNLFQSWGVTQSDAEQLTDALL
ncbi:MAG: type II secretory protein PulK, partial [Opitutaceae bacterium]